MSKPDPQPFVSVVLPARNAARHLPATLAALLAGDYPAERMEVLVVDGASTDDTAAVVDAFAARDGRVRRLANAAGTTPAGLNVGLRAARGQVIVRLDAHARPAPDYVAACVAALARTGADVVGGPMVGVGETPFGAAVAVATAVPFGAGNAAFRVGGEGPVDTVYLGAWQREVFQRVGLFDERLERNQDYELCERIRRAGGVVWLDPAIRTVTVTRATPVALARQYFGYGRGRAATSLRHPGSLRPRQLVPAAFVAALAALAAAAPWSRRARPLLGGVLVLYLAADTWAAGWASGQASDRSLAVADQHGLPPATAGRPVITATLASTARLLVAFPVMHLAWGVGFWAGLARAASRRHDGSRTGGLGG